MLQTLSHSFHGLTVHCKDPFLGSPYHARDLYSQNIVIRYLKSRTCRFVRYVCLYVYVYIHTHTYTYAFTHTDCTIYSLVKEQSMVGLK